ncbi:MAG: diguanylate cyclase [Vicinamibacterales bacterium]
MLKHVVTALDLRRTVQEDPELEWLRELIDQTLAMLRDLLAAGGEPERTDLASRIDHCRAVLAVDDDAGVARSQTTQCLSRVREVVSHARQQEIDRRQEMAALVALVREAVMTVGAEVNTVHSSVGQSAGRFEAIGTLDDPAQIKARLIAEVNALKKATAERRQVWETTSRQFNERVEVLERQLVTSRNEAALDPLTGIANRRTFDRTCQEWIRSARSRFVLALLDVDDFKSINDTHGHAAGDQVLVTLAQALLASVRPDDLVARLGGDEFAILASELTLRQAEGRFGKTISDLAGASAGEAWTPKVSCGLAEFSAGDTYHSLFERADEALYAAKRGGKHRVATKARAFIRDLMKR